MRAKFFLPLAILGLGVTIILLEETQGLTQGFPPSKGGKSSFKYDPQQMFDKMAQGKEFFVISEIRDPDRRDEYNVFAKKTGIANGIITREQYLRYFEVKDQIRAALTFEKRAQGKDYFIVSEIRDPDRRDELAVFAKKIGISGDKITRDQYLRFIDMKDQIRADLSFDTLSQGKGFFAISEVRDRDRREQMTLFAKKIGIANDKITRDQYLSFLDQRDHIREELRSLGTNSPGKGGAGGPLSGQPNGPNGSFSKPIPSNGADVIGIEESRLETWRAGRLPNGLPAWWKKVDKNEDGQIALYEWNNAIRELMKEDKTLPDFQAIDANDDGLLTPDEYLRYERQRALAANGNGNGSSPDGKYANDAGMKKKGKDKKKGIN